MNLRSLPRRIELLTPRQRRRERNRRLTCECGGWWFPHRIGSRASIQAIRQYGTNGCCHSPKGARA